MSIKNNSNVIQTIFGYVTKLPQERWKRAVLYFLFMYVPNIMIVESTDSILGANQATFVSFIAIAIAVSFFKLKEN